MKYKDNKNGEVQVEIEIPDLEVLDAEDLRIYIRGVIKDFETAYNRSLSMLWKQTNEALELASKEAKFIRTPKDKEVFADLISELREFAHLNGMRVIEMSTLLTNLVDIIEDNTFETMVAEETEFNLAEILQKINPDDLN